MISQAELKTMVYDEPINRGKRGGEIYENPVINTTIQLLLTLQRSGKRLLFIVFDTTGSYRIVAKYRNNTIKPMLFPNVVLDFKAYNNAYVLCKVNDIESDCSILFYDMEYENVLMTA